MTIINYDRDKYPQFVDMLVEYFDDIPEHITRGKILDLLHSKQQQSIIQIALCLDNQKPIGFTIYQIDCPESDWCKRPGWGFIREFYISPEYRNKGFGSQLAAYSEIELQRLGAKQLYVTAETSIGFWEKCGYVNTHTRCSNDQFIMVKE